MQREGREGGGPEETVTSEVGPYLPSPDAETRLRVQDGQDRRFRDLVGRRRRGPPASEIEDVVAQGARGSPETQDVV